MADRLTSTHPVHQAAFAAVLFALTLFGLGSGIAAASDGPAGPPAPGRAAVAPAAADQELPPPAEPATKTEAPAPVKTGPGDTGSGGVKPKPTGGKDGAGKGGNGTGKGGTDEVIPDESEPAFVDGDGGSTGGVSPDVDGETPSTDPLKVSPLAVPNFLINRFEIPPFLLPIYQACGTEYGIPWTVLAAINRIETAFGTNLSTSYAGAMGWMQFLDSSWKMFGVDANGDGLKDPYNPVDAICAAASYLKIAGYAEDPRKAIFAYNHADWYVNDILEHAAGYAKIPAEMISALTGLTEGARFPVAAEADYEGQLSTEQARRKGLASQEVESSAHRRTVEITAEGGSPVIAVNDGVVTAIDPTKGTVTVTDAYGNRYSYARLGSVAEVHPVPRERDTGPAAGADEATTDDEAAHEAADRMGSAKAKDDPRSPDEEESESDPQVEDEPSGEISEVLVDPDAAARAAAEAAADDGAGGGSDGEEAGDGGQGASPIAVAEDRRSEQEQLSRSAAPDEATRNTENARGRVYANPLRPQNHKRASVDGRSVATPGSAAGSSGVEGLPGDYVIYDGSRSGIYRFDEKTAQLHPLKKGSRVIAGTVLGRLAETGPGSSIDFSIQPGGEDTPKIDPKPFLDGWRLLADTNIYNSKGGNRFADRLGVGGVLLLSKPALQRRILGDRNIQLSDCDRNYIASGTIDRRLMAALAFLSEKGYELLISSMYCGREVSITTSGNISNHSRASAADIAAINGEIVSSSTQGPGSLTDRLARELLSLQGIMAPDEVITLLNYPQPAGFAMGDHDDHLHLGYRAATDSDVPGGSIQATLGAAQWERLTERLGEIRNPEVPDRPSSSSLPADKDD